MEHQVRDGQSPVLVLQTLTHSCGYENCLGTNPVMPDGPGPTHYTGRVGGEMRLTDVPRTSEEVMEKESRGP